MKNKIFIIIFAVLIAASLLIIFFAKDYNDGAAIAEIIQDGVVIDTVNLNDTVDSYDITVPAKDGGYNTVHISRGAVSISEADCPDKLCVNQGEITNGVYPIVCLPHKLTVRITSGGTSQENFDAITGR